MNVLIVLLLAVLWVSILAPGALRGRRARSPLSSVDAFDRRMGVLAASRARRVRQDPGSSGRPVLVAGRALSGSAARRRRTLARRRALLQALLAGALCSGVLALVVGRAFVGVFLAVALALAGYVGFLVHRRVALERTRQTVRALPVGPVPDPEDGAPAAATDQPLADVPVAAVGGAG